MSERYKKSEQLLARSEKVIPLGSQTFSKSKTQLPYGVSPYFAAYAKGAYMWDVDGNKYLDMVNALAAITIGHADERITNAVKEQLDKGTIFSLASELEVTAAELICELVPCAEMVRFGKNGSDATAGAVRIARAYTGRDHVLVCGYHGWQDWYIGTTSKKLGIPQATIDLAHTFTYNNLESFKSLLKEYEGKVAAVVIEPSNVFAPDKGFLETIKELTKEQGAVLIFDETVTGFRFSNGGAQALYGVTPDLATFGKGLANGYPISAVAGKKEIMALMEEVFFSFTFGGETLSLVAAIETMKILKEQPVLSSIEKVGSYLKEELSKLVVKYQLDDVFSVAGHPSWSFILPSATDWADVWKIKTLMIQHMFERGIYMIGSHNLSYAHKVEHMDEVLKAYESFFELLNEAKEKGSIDEYIKGKVLESLFKVR